MTALFMPIVNTCCFSLPLCVGSVLIFLVDLVRAGYMTFAYYHPLCYNLSLTAGLGAYANFLSFYNMITSVLCAIFALMILLSKLYVNVISPEGYRFEYCTNGNLYVAFTFTSVVINILFHVIHYMLVSKAGKICVTGYKFGGGTFTPLNQTKGMSVPLIMLVIFIVDSLIRVCNSAAINCLEEEVNLTLD